MKIAFIGLGTMGYPMAGHIAARHEVVVYNRSPAKAEAWAAEHRGRIAGSAAEAAAGAEAVLACLPTDADTAALATGAGGVFAAMAPGAIFVDHGSGAATTARMFAEEAGKHASSSSTRRHGGRVGAERRRSRRWSAAMPTCWRGGAGVARCFARTCAHMLRDRRRHVTKMVNVIIATATGAAMRRIVCDLPGSIRLVVDVLKKDRLIPWQLSTAPAR